MVALPDTRVTSKVITGPVALHTVRPVEEAPYQRTAGDIRGYKSVGCCKNSGTGGIGNSDVGWVLDVELNRVCGRVGVDRLDLDVADAPVGGDSKHRLTEGRGSGGAHDDVEGGLAAPC